MKREKKPRSLRALILGGLGKAWMYWPPRLEAKKRAKHPTKKGWYACEICKQEREKIEIDHIVPCIKPSEGWQGWDAYITARFREDPKDFQAICHECHLNKSRNENQIRRANKKKEK